MSAPLQEVHEGYLLQPTHLLPLTSVRIFPIPSLEQQAGEERGKIQINRRENVVPFTNLLRLPFTQGLPVTGDILLR